MMHRGSIVGDGENPSPLFLCYRRVGVRKLLPCGERRLMDDIKVEAKDPTCNKDGHKEHYGILAGI